MLLAATEDFWRWRPHPEVWVLVVGLIALYVYAVRVIGPKAVPEGEPVVTRSQKAWFVAAVVVMWVASDWPLHDIGEDYLYSAHMLQHLLMMMVVPPMFLLALPRWLADLVIGDGTARRAIRWMVRPVAAAVIFNSVTMLLHWPAVVNASLKYAGLHYTLHLVTVVSGLIMWVPVCGPWKEWRLSLPGQMIYLFLMSIVPTVPGAWLTFASRPIYTAYAHVPRLWGLSPIDDQQLAGVIMKLLGGMYLWTIITVLFFKWAMAQEAMSRWGRPPVRPAVPSTDGPDDGDRSGGGPADGGAAEVLTYDEVQHAFESTEPVPEPASPGAAPGDG